MGRDVFSVLMEQIDTDVTTIKEFMTSGRLNSLDEYRGACGKITGLLLARQYVKDLQQKTEYEDE